MANLSLKHIYKVYPNGTKAVNDFNMQIDDKEFIVFVGPSGCGKSTMLRMVAGLEEISAGELRIGDVVVNDMEPKDRDIAMVFQNYALYPHMTIYENIAFGLQMRQVPQKDENGNVLVSYYDRNRSVFRISYEESGLPITVYTYENLNAAQRIMAYIHAGFVLAYVLETGAVAAAYLLRRNRVAA